MKHILMIEEDEKIVSLIGPPLKDIDCILQHAAGGKEGLALARDHAYDLIVLDQVLPDGSGTELYGRLRQENIAAPVMILTSRPEETDEAQQVHDADDYLAKPFSMGEFIARVKAILRRTELQQETEAGIIRRGILSMDLARKEVTLGEEPVTLAPKEFELLHLFMANPGRSYTREQLLQEVWGYNFAGFEHTVNSCISRLRARLEKDIAHPEYILTTWGVGFRFTDAY